MENVLPSDANCITLMLPAQRPVPLAETPDDRRANWRRESDEPSEAKLITLTAEPSLAPARMDNEDPSEKKSSTLAEDPT
jgi:hypothetical protein